MRGTGTEALRFWYRGSHVCHLVKKRGRVVQSIQSFSEINFIKKVIWVYCREYNRVINF